MPKCSKSILDLPELVLYHVCSLLTNPFDLRNFGDTCTHLQQVSSAPSLWWNIAIRLLKGLWFSLDNLPNCDHPREWFLSLLQNIKARMPDTMSHCEFGNGEVWLRTESDEFRCFLGLLQISHLDKLKENHPGVLYERWLYDIALYKRTNPSTTFDEELANDLLVQLSLLGQAKERDLRARKQPNKSPIYYVKVIGASDNWTVDLFPAGLSASTCPLLICPFRESWNMEASGMSGLLMCLSWAVEKKITSEHKTDIIPLNQMTIMIRSLVESFHLFLSENMEAMKSKWGSYCLGTAVKNLAQEDDFDLTPWQKHITEQLNLTVDCKQLVQSLQSILETYGGIDGTVDFLRCEKRKFLMLEIEKTMFPEDANGDRAVTRINLTDCDLIGGDNSRQEMSAAAFVSAHGVLVTWHLIGRLRF